ncbi:hypothetical protein OAI29_02795 [Amylibacter sp.]|nr:hypothetical protein [Amylibacter sp.]
MMRKSFIRTFLGLESSVIYYALLRILQVLGGIVTLLFVTLYFTEELQGYYYTFASLIALQTFLELGLYIVVTTYASHQWSSLNLDENQQISGDETSLGNLGALVKFVSTWYGVATILFVLLIGTIGFILLSSRDAKDLSWGLPWIFHVIFSAALFWSFPFLYILEGCNQVTKVAKFKCVQILVGNIIFWLALSNGIGLWAVPLYSGVLALGALFYILFVWGKFFRSLRGTFAKTSFNWKEDLFSMQWRLALQGLVNYFGWAAFPLIIFTYHGPALAGKMGMSQHIIMSVLSLAMVWTTAKVPNFGMLISKGNFVDLDRMWFSAAFRSTMVTFFGILSIYIIIAVGQDLDMAISQRILNHNAFLILSIGAVFATMVQCIAIYLRAHKREVLTIPATICSLMIGGLSWHLGIGYAEYGIVYVYLGITSMLMFPASYMIFRICRSKWHVLNSAV